MNGADGTAIDKPAGIYQFVDKSGAALALPQQADATIEIIGPGHDPYTKIAGFDMNPDRPSPTLRTPKRESRNMSKTGSELENGV